MLSGSAEGTTMTSGPCQTSKANTRTDRTTRITESVSGTAIQRECSVVQLVDGDNGITVDYPPSTTSLRLRNELERDSYEGSCTRQSSTLRCGLDSELSSVDSCGRIEARMDDTAECRHHGEGQVVAFHLPNLTGRLSNAHSGTTSTLASLIRTGGN
jgi:hypothetical protein